MNVEIFVKKTTSLFGALLIGGIAFAQQPQQQQQRQQPPAQRQQQPNVDTDVSDKELKQFAKASVKVEKIQQEGQKEMQQAIEDEDMDMQTFNQMVGTAQSGQESDASEEDQEKFERASSKVMEIQQGLNEKIQGAVEDAGMDFERFQEILMVLRQDPELFEKVNKMMEEERKS